MLINLGQTIYDVIFSGLWHDDIILLAYSEAMGKWTVLLLGNGCGIDQV